MPKFAANLSMMYQEVDFLDRFAAAAADGFDAAEFLFPYGYVKDEIKSRLTDAGLGLVLFNCPPGDWNAGERGMASVPGREEEFKRSIDSALDYAQVLGNQRLHVMAGLLAPGQDRARHREVYVRNLSYAAAQAAAHGITILIEPINTRDMPGYFLNYQGEAHEICEEVGAKNLQVQFDMYHCQIMEGDVATKLRRNIARIGHMQIAGVPGRHEPDTGELHYPYLFQQIDQLKYDGWIGCEYRPKNGTSEGLGWLRSWIGKKH
ncbi:MAG TPA: 2-oxo-tetronate isomerase [Noviherbaspirillum sp.]|jgi:hydroxypyruvate isomerase|uniref:2-oxo-tetronate isomerase n=1 Tax=Noviherbaspirillum sp. TaxID=1926288 RepID=UPI002DDD5474|nr:2-oxo-tetronate isomerase [Noviherbaspirillum sp.]HEV2608761.1 2-oxo-tetronate isomerase [Noviherbaspirillum sp.]